MSSLAAPFRLLDLPSEVVILIAAAVDDRPVLNSTFPPNPCAELFHLRATASTFYRLIHPTLWRSRSFQPRDIDDQESSDESEGGRGGYSARRTRKRHSLKRFRSLLEKNDLLIAEGAEEGNEESKLLPINIAQVNFYGVGQTGLKGEDSGELSAVVSLVERLVPHLEIAFFFELDLGKTAGDALIKLLHSAPRLMSLRLNQCDIGPLRQLDLMPPFPALRTLHVSRSSLSLFHPYAPVDLHLLMHRSCMEGNETYRFYDSALCSRI